MYVVAVSKSTILEAAPLGKISMERISEASSMSDCRIMQNVLFVHFEMWVQTAEPTKYEAPIIVVVKGIKFLSSEMDAVAVGSIL